MDKLDKLSRLKNAVKSGNPELVEHALEEIKERGDLSYIAPLLQFLHQPYSKEIKQQVYQIFTDLKLEQAVDTLISAMKQVEDLEILEHLTAACWQNGLNYSSHLNYFVDLVLEQEFPIAFEAFTVVENMYGKIEQETEQALLEKIEKALPASDNSKEYLLKGLLEIIPNIPLNQDPVDF